MNCLLLFFLVYYLKMNWLINQKTDYSTNKGFIIMLYDLHYSNKYNFLPLLPKLLGVNHLQEPVQRPHGFPVFQWFYCVKGQGEFIINGQRSIISKGQGLLILTFPTLIKDFPPTGPFILLDLVEMHVPKYYRHCIC